VQTKFVVFLDADDTLHPQFLRCTLAMWRRSRPRPAVVYTPAALTGIASGYTHAKAFDPWTLAVANYVPATALIRTAALKSIGGYSPHMTSVTHEDYDVYLTLVEHGFRIKGHPRPLFRYRVAQRSMTKQSDPTKIRAVLENRHPWIILPPTRSGGASVWRRLIRIQFELRQRRWRAQDSLLGRVRGHSRAQLGATDY
jgi:cellulose synthase/poly-beta-1,6-N-acetylglucosamine synthase-like glycosyltransferase